MLANLLHHSLSDPFEMGSLAEHGDKACGQQASMPFLSLRLQVHVALPFFHARAGSELRSSCLGMSALTTGPSHNQM